MLTGLEPPYDLVGSRDAVWRVRYLQPASSQRQIYLNRHPEAAATARGKIRTAYLVSSQRPRGRFGVITPAGVLRSYAATDFWPPVNSIGYYASTGLDLDVEIGDRLVWIGESYSSPAWDYGRPISRVEGAVFKAAGVPGVGVNYGPIIDEIDGGSWLFNDNFASIFAMWGTNRSRTTPVSDGTMGQLFWGPSDQQGRNFGFQNIVCRDAVNGADSNGVLRDVAAYVRGGRTFTLLVFTNNQGNGAGTVSAKRTLTNPSPQDRQVYFQDLDLPIVAGDRIGYWSAPDPALYGFAMVSGGYQYTQNVTTEPNIGETFAFGAGTFNEELGLGGIVFP